MSTWYKAGVVNVTQTSPIVTGVGTLFSLNVTPGDIFTKDGGKIYEIESVDSNTQLTLVEPYAETTATNMAYAVIAQPGDPLEADVLTKIQTLVALWQQREEDFTNWLTGTGSVNLTTLAGGTVSVKTPTQLDLDMASSAKAAAGAMVTGNTETGISVTYEVSDQTFDFAVQFAGSGGTYGSANTSARSDHTHSAYAASGHSHSTFGLNTAGFVPAPVTATGRVLHDDGTWDVVSIAAQGIGALTDVVISGALNGDVLGFNGANWVNRTLATAGIAAAVHTHSAADITSGTLAIARIPTGTTSATAALGNHTHTLDGLSDVAVTSPATGHVIYHNGAIFVNGSPSAAGLAASSHSHDASTAFTTGTIPIARIPTGTTGSTVAAGNHTHVAANITDWTEALQDGVGTMFTGNTQTGITLTYDDPTGKINVTLNYAGSGGDYGTANNVARSNHTHTFTHTWISDWDEAVQDEVGNMVTGNTETGLTVTYDDSSGKLNFTLNYAGTGGDYGNANNVARANHTHTLPHTWVSDWDESVQDTVGAMVTGNTETGITVTYDDTAGKLDYTLNYAGSGGTYGNSNNVARANHTHDGTYAVVGANTFTGQQTVSSATPAYKWSETDTGVEYTARASAGLWQLFKDAATGTALKFDGTILTATTYAQYSDARLKDNVDDISYALNIVELLRGVEFTWKDSGAAAFGVIAQEVEPVVSRLVHTDEEGIKSVDYVGMVPLLIEAVKALSARVKVLEAR